MPFLDGALLALRFNRGAAYHGYPGSPSLAAALRAVREAHPGFCESSDNLVVNDGAEGMR
jgi:hypothetical protein